MFTLDAIVSILGLVAPPVYDFVKKKFIKSEADSAEATMSTLATAKPEVLSEYVAALATKITADVTWFNRDVIGAPSQWVVNLRAAIRPVTVVLSISILAANMIWNLNLDPGTRISLELNISNWFGSRLVTKD